MHEHTKKMQDNMTKQFRYCAKNQEQSINLPNNARDDLPIINYGHVFALRYAFVDRLE
jgi:methyltransferase-like protein